MVDKLPLNSHEKCKLVVRASGTSRYIGGHLSELVVQHVTPVQEPISWQVTIQVCSSVSELRITCQSLGDITTSSQTATYILSSAGNKG